MADYVDFENTIVPAKEYIGKVKKLFYRVESEELAELVTPQFYDDQVDASITESMGTIPIRVLSKHIFPTENDTGYSRLVMPLARKVLELLLGERYDGRIDLSGGPFYSGGFNFNNGPDYIHPFIGGDSPLYLDPHFTAAVNFLDGSARLGGRDGNTLGETLAHLYRDPASPFPRKRPNQLVDAVIYKDDEEYACFSLPIVLNRESLEQFQGFSQQYINGGDLKFKYFSLLNTLHELDHKLAHWSEHSYDSLEMGPELDPLADVAQQTNFSDAITRQKYYTITLDDGRSYIASWQLYELHNAKNVFSQGHYHYLTVPEKPMPLNLMLHLQTSYEGGPGQGSKSQFELVFNGNILVPEVAFDQNTNTISQGRYWLLAVYRAGQNFDPTKKPILYRRRQRLSQDLNSRGFFTEPQSVLQPENMGQERRLYKAVNLQRLAGPTGYIEVDLDE